MRQVTEIQNKVGIFKLECNTCYLQIPRLLRLKLTVVFFLIQCRTIVAEKIVQRFDVVKVPRYVSCV